ncbi:ATP-binding cassette domain-containing protein [Polaribacter sp.]|uniref:ATP-binding cassette domain-containing protein n=1 Tax=Polaribacter sp. TaxID=1920175 RepID=UPI003F4B86F1
MRKQLHHSYIDMKWVSISKIKSTDVLTIMTKEVSKIASFIKIIIELFGTIIITSFQLCLALFISSKATLIVFCSASIMILIQRKTLFSSIQNGRKSIKHSKAFYNNLVEHFQIIKLTKSQNLDKNQKVSLENFSDDIYINRVSFENDKAKLGLIYDIGSAIILCVFVYIGFSVLLIPIVELTLLIVIFSRILPRVKSSIGNIQILLNLTPIINEVKTKLETFKHNKDFSNKLSSDEIYINDKIEVKNLCFSYTDGHAILSDVSFVIKKNTITAITGVSGSGKTTLVDILTGTLKPTTGKILIDDKNLSKIGNNNWGNNIAYMTQERFLFHDSIRNNMLWSNPNASEKDIWEALEKANAKDYVVTLDSGIDTIVGDRGMLISGGERQRLSLAMTLVRKPLFLVLDEATNELDEENENEIIEELIKLKSSLTIFIITHRISTLKKVDQSFVLKNCKLTNFILNIPDE